MIKPSPDTVFVVGAGASVDLKLPLGSKLKSDIAKLLDIRYEHGYRLVAGDTHVISALESLSAARGEKSINKLQQECWRIRDAMPQAMSIDNFLDVHRGDKDLEAAGKIAIVKAILDAERESTLHFEKSSTQKPNFVNLEPTWLNYMFQSLTENCREVDLEQRLSRIAFIVFNYDRCLEEFLYYALQNYYAISPQRAADFVRKIAIYHPYGRVGSPPWWGESNTAQVTYGGSPHGAELVKLAQSIKTFTEGTDESDGEIVAIRRAVMDATRLVFLGFAFHPLNMKLLAPNRIESPSTARREARAFGTAVGISNSDRAIIQEDIQWRTGIPAHRVELFGENCAALFGNYRRSLGFVPMTV